MARVRLVSQRSKSTLLLPGHSNRLLRSIVAQRATGPSYSSQASSQSVQKSSKSAYQERMRAKEKDREFFESVLGASTTKRDAKAFLSRFGQKGKVVERPKQPSQSSDIKVNLGTLYSPNKAVETSPVFSFKDTDSQFPKPDPQIHVVVVKIRDPQTFGDDVLEGVARTLGQLAKLGVISIVVMDMGPSSASQYSAIQDQSRRLSDAILTSSDSGARIVDQALEIDPESSTISIKLKDLLLNPLSKGMISIIPPLAVGENSHVEPVRANDIVFALTSQFSKDKEEENVGSETQQIKISLDRIIFLDQSGGIPDPLNPGRTQPFVNLEQEFKSMDTHLKQLSTESNKSSNLQQSLECLHQCLALLPDSASALLMTPEEVAASALQKYHLPDTPGVGTRRRRNRLIHNILTNKPIVSASLPLGRLQSSTSLSTSRYTSTFFKHGMPVLMVPDPSQDAWTSPLINGNYLRLDNDPRIDFRKLIHLMEDSFGRPLDVEHYLKRIENHLAGIIIAGDYEGGAILTWEDPPGRPGRPPVPYLDKFAVLRRSQGSGGVADIVFNAMVRNCFPHGVVWRSRQDNPVNKWYFERATGTWQVPNTKWTMFWTGSSIDFHGTKDLHEAEERWKDYVAVCGSIQPSWADAKKS